MLRFGRLKYLVFDIISVVITSTFIVLLGYSFGKLIEKTLTGTKKFDLWIALGIAIIAIITTLIRKYKRLKKLRVRIIIETETSD